MNMLINHFIIASRAYSQQSPTCTRVNNLVYIFSIQHPWSLSADHVCSWKRFCPCLYYTALYVLCKTLMSPNLTWLGFPGGAGEVVAAVKLWNKGAGARSPPRRRSSGFCRRASGFGFAGVVLARWASPSREFWSSRLLPRIGRAHV